MGEALKGTVATRPRTELAADQIYRCLRDDIMSCRLPPGAQIDAAGVAERYNVSKTPVRDGLRRLAIEGLVRILPRAGYRVSPVTPDSFSDTFDLYAAIGPFAAVQAARRASTEDAGRLAALFGAYKRCTGRHDRQMASRSLQNAVIACARNRKFEEICAAALTEIERLQSLAPAPEPASEADRLGDLAAAIGENDPEKARQAMAGLIMRTREHLFHNLLQAGIFVDGGMAPAQPGVYGHG